jgi:hypothetical protein
MQVEKEMCDYIVKVLILEAGKQSIFCHFQLAYMYAATTK